MPRAQIIRRSRLFFQFKAPSGRDAIASAPSIQTASTPTIAPVSQNIGCLRPPRQVPAVGAQFCARTINATSWAKIIGCLRSPSHSEPCEDFHHNSSIFKAAVTRLGRTRLSRPYKNMNYCNRCQP